MVSIKMTKILSAAHYNQYDNDRNTISFSMTNVKMPNVLITAGYHQYPLTEILTIA